MDENPVGADFSRKSLYPDLVEAGGLALSLQTALEDVGSTLRVQGLNLSEDRPAPFAYARVARASRESQVFVARDERLFLFDFWSQGVNLANGRSTDLIQLARALHAWIEKGLPLRQMREEFPYLVETPDAWAFEQGVEVEHLWKIYLETIPEWMPELTEALRTAAARPQLRQLFPYTSHNILCLSRCTGYPYSRDVLAIAPRGDGLYRVIDNRNKEVGSGSAEEAVAIVVANLPTNCGPAVPGTADDLPS